MQYKCCYLKKVKKKSIKLERNIYGTTFLKANGMFSYIGTFWAANCISFHFSKTRLCFWCSKREFLKYIKLTFSCHIDLWHVRAKKEEINTKEPVIHTHQAIVCYRTHLATQRLSLYSTWKIIFFFSKILLGITQEI